MPHVVRLPHEFIPRTYQADLWNCILSGRVRHAYYVCHRRAGKDKTCINILTAAACQRVGMYLYLFPQHNQSRKVIWKGIDGEGFRFLDHIPKDIVAKSNSTEMSVELINGSIIQLGGSNNFDALMGSNPVGIVYSEFPLHNPLARQYLNPILAENGGFEILQGTPRGRNHAHKVWESVQGNPEWFVRSLTVHDTLRPDGRRVVTDAEIDTFRQSGMDENLIRQEFFCDWHIGIQGAYYTAELDAVEREQRIGRFPIRKDVPVWTFWDLGVSDNTVITLMQPDGHFLNIIACYSSNNQGLDHYIQKLNEYKHKFGIRYEAHYAPHDIRQREFTSARSRHTTAMEAGIHFQITPNVSIDDGIQSVRALFPRLRFHVEHCQHMLTCLREYRRKYDEINRVYHEKPLHDWTSDCFTGDTHILTRTGQCRIMDLPQCGEVLTLNGWKKYLNPSIKRISAELVEVKFTDGNTVRCTPDHMFLTENGWRSAESLEKGSKIQSTLTNLPSISKEVCTEFGHPVYTSQKGVLRSTEMYGDRRLGRFLKNVIYTIRTTIQKITCLETWNAWMQTSICRLRGIVPRKIKKIIFQKKHAIAQRNGMDLKKEGSGTEGMLSGLKAGIPGLGKKSIVCGVKTNSMHLSEKVHIHKSTAQTNASMLTIESVSKVKKRENVWCITVPEAGHFSLANGAVVHNCADSVRYLAVVWNDLFRNRNTQNSVSYNLDAFAPQTFQGKPPDATQYRGFG